MNTAIVDRLWLSRPASLVRFMALVALGVVLLTASAKISVPFIPVPMTMQTFAILVICTMYGLHLGVSTMISYLALGAIGFPVFAFGGGIAYMVGPTGGFLFGFLVAALVLGIGVRLGFDRRNLSCLILMGAAVLCIFACGYLWLSTLIGYQKAWAAGVLPFLLGDAFKILLAVLSIRILRYTTEK